MTREEAKQLLPIIKAFSEGKTIQYKNGVNPKWKETDCPIWEKESKYRIKPEPKYRPFKSQEECWNEMQKHLPFGWIRNIDIQSLYNIEYVGHNTYGIWINNSIVYFDAAFNDYNFADGTPFGIKEDI